MRFSRTMICAGISRQYKTIRSAIVGLQCALQVFHDYQKIC
jgi:hypothetical protein